jgi:hypothetical protein
MISGDIVGKPRRVTMQEIESVALVGNGLLKEINTDTIDKKIPAKFSGVPLLQIFKKYAAEGTGRVIIKAWDKYRIIVDIDTMKKFEPMMATREDGRYISYKQRGPARIVVGMKRTPSERLKEKVEIFAIKEMVFIK